MPIIKPISDLRNRTQEISTLCHAEDQPVFITKNGVGDLVVMSLTHYERLQNLLDLYQKLGKAEALDAEGEQGYPHHEVFSRLRDKIK